MPGESPAVFGDALRRLAAAATYLYQDGPRYWYSTQPTVTKMAEDRAEQLKRDPDKIVAELDKRLRADLARKGDFARVHPMPQSSADVPDDLDARLVVLGSDAPYSREAGSAAETATKAILESRGSTPRLYRNTLVFLAADKTRLQELDEAVRRYLAWDSILDKGSRDELTAHQVRQAETQKAAADSAVTARIPETYQWLLVPIQETPQSPVTWQATRLSGQDALAVRASKKLRSDELLITGFAPTRLKMELDRVPLWSGDHVAVRQLVEHFARYLYLPRLSDPAVLLGAISDGLGLMLWQQESFAFADSFDEAESRYRGLRGGERISLVDAHAPEMLVKPDVARRQLDAERPQPTDGGTPPGLNDGSRGGIGVGPGPGAVVEPPLPDPVSIQPKRFHGSVLLDVERVGRDASRIADEVIAHLNSLVGANVRVTLEIDADIPSGAPDHVVRTVTENGRQLKFVSQGIERD